MLHCFFSSAERPGIVSFCLLALYKVDIFKVPSLSLMHISLILASSYDISSHFLFVDIQLTVKENENQI